MRRFPSTSFTPGGAPVGRFPGVIDIMPLQGKLQYIEMLDAL